ncbi:MAG: tol-pal system protein YbgF [Steroidobacteraceae bacterium]
MAGLSGVRSWRWLAAGLGLALSGCALTPAAEDPVQVRLGDLDSRLGRVERVVDNQSLVQLSQRVDALEAQLRELRGRSEEMQNASDSQRKQQRDLYNDLGQRLTALEQAVKAAAASGVAPPAAIGATPAVSNSGGATAPATEELAAYQRAFDAIKSGDYSGAIAQFRAFMGNYPNSTLIGNAQYWIGEAYYVPQDYDSAATAFRAVGERWPNSAKAPDALLKLGYTQVELKKYALARQTLTQVSQRYPGTDAARLATEKLAKLPTDAR